MGHFPEEASVRCLFIGEITAVAGWQKAIKCRSHAELVVGVQLEATELGINPSRPAIALSTAKRMLKIHLALPPSLYRRIQRTMSLQCAGSNG